MIKVGIVGAGNMAWEYLRVINDIPGLNLSGIYSRTRSKAVELAKKSKSETKVCDNISELKTKANIEFLIICVSEENTVNICLEAAKYDWPCLVEKPLGLNFDDFSYFKNKISSKSSNFRVAFNRRFYSSVTNLKSKLDDFNGDRLVTIHDQEDIIKAKKVGFPEQVIENWMYANSIHLIDLFNVFCRGSIVNVENIIPWNKNKPKYVHSIINYDSGDIGIYHAVWNRPYPWQISISSKSIIGTLRPIEEASYIFNESRKNFIIEKEEHDNKYKPGIYKMAEQIIKVMNNQYSSLTTLEEYFKTISLIKRIYE